jgi:hypothetical protein
MVRAYLCRDRKMRSGVLAFIRPSTPRDDQTWADKMPHRTGTVLTAPWTPVEILDLLVELVEPGGVVEVNLVVRARPRS